MELHRWRPSSGEAALNAALVSADIARGYEEYFALIDLFYAECVEVSSESTAPVTVDRIRLREVVAGWLVPFHVFAEIGSLSVSLQAVAEIPSDAPATFHSTWKLELTGVTGSRCTLTWDCARTWKDDRVVAECHYNYQQIGGPLGPNDLHWAKEPPDQDPVPS